jgi:eukaryotic-like serine/threonine-protein kinase
MHDRVEPPRSLAGLTIGQYEVRELIGRGGMGEVYRAQDRRFERPVAIKTVRVDRGSDPTWRRRFLNEVRGASRVVHPYVATVFDVIEHDGFPLLVMELVEGRRLADAIQEGPIETDRLTRYAREMAQALAAIHHSGLIHCDLKPGNVVLTLDDHVKVMDFGLVSRNPVATPGSAAAGSSTTETAVEAGQLRGTLAYMSPEQLRGERPDARSDLFSLGVVLFEGLHGHHPFLRPSAAATITAILSESPIGGGTLPFRTPLGRVIRGLLEKEPARRCPSAEALIGQVDAIAHRRIPPLGWAAVGATAVALVVAIGLWLRGVPARPVVAVLPFIDRTGAAAADREGELIADALAARLARAPGIRVVSGERLEDLLAALPESAGVEQRLDRIDAGLPAEWLIAGELLPDHGQRRAVIHVRRKGVDHPLAEFSVRGAGIIEVADGAMAQLRRLLGQAEPRAPAVLPEGPTTESPEAEELFRRARRLVREESYGEALTLLERALALDPTFLAALVAQSETLHGVGFERRARETIDRAEELARAQGLPADSRVALELRATASMIRHQDSEAAETLRLLVSRYPDDPAPRLELAAVLDHAGHHTEALSALDEAGRLDRFDPRILGRRAEVLGDQGSID